MPTKPNAKTPAAKKPAKKKKPPLVKEAIQYPYKFTPQEIADMSVEMRAHMAKHEELEMQKKASAADFKLRMDNEQNSIKMLRTKCDTGEETRPLEAHVVFDVAKNVKTFLHPITKTKIRDEQMSPADHQLPMFKRTPDGKEAVAPKGATDEPTGTSAPPPKKRGKKGKEAEPGENAGQTNLGDALGAAASITNAPKIDLYLAEIDDHAKLTRAFRKAAKAAGWSEAQQSVMIDALRACDGVEKMKETLAPHIIKNPSEEPPPV